MTIQKIGTDALEDNAVSTDKSQPFGNILLDSSAAGTDVGDRILLDRTNANGQDAGDAINVEKEILDIDGINVASRKQLKLGAVLLESGTTDAVDGDVLLLDATASGVDEGEMLLYNETFNPSTFNIGGTLTAGQAILVDSSGIGFEFGSGGEKNDIYWSAYGSTDQTNISNNTIQQVVYNEVRYQSSHNGFDTSTGEFTCPTGGAGLYYISGLATIGGTGTANNATRSVYNWITYESGGSTGNFVRAGNFLIDNSYEGSQGSNSPVSGIFQLAVGDKVYIRAQAYGNNFSIDLTSNNAFFGGFRILAT